MFTSLLFVFQGIMSFHVGFITLGHVDEYIHWVNPLFNNREINLLWAYIRLRWLTIYKSYSCLGFRLGTLGMSYSFWIWPYLCWLLHSDLTLATCGSTYRMTCGSWWLMDLLLPFSVALLLLSIYVLIEIFGFVFALTVKKLASSHCSAQE